jgi:drug/metabolite transporter (DMT)-like permease
MAVADLEQPTQQKVRHDPLRATLIGLVAILLWSSLALFTTWTGKIPAFQLTFLTFLIAFVLSAVVIGVKSRGTFTAFRLPGQAMAIGVGGLFGFHFLYFLAMQNAPPAEVSLLAYLWPLLIVVFSAFLPRERLRWFHLVGCVSGFLGAALLVLKGTEVFELHYLRGYAAALCCALTWSVYSVVSRTMRGIPSDAVGAYCGGTALLALICHLLMEETVRPDPAQWLAVIALGVGPVGFAFFAWDYGVKWGHIKALGGASYLAPLLSTTLLVLFGQTAFSWKLALACLLIVGGAFFASGDLKKRNPASRPPCSARCSRRWRHGCRT